MKMFKKRRKKKGKKLPKSDLVKFIETNSTIPPTGKVVVTTYKGKKYNIDYFAPKPTPEILDEFVKSLKIENVKDYKYE